MPYSITMSELANTADISEKCHQIDEPIFVTKNGCVDMVIMSMELYEKIIMNQEMYSDIEISEKQKVEGKTRDAKESLSDMKIRYEL
ncbi:type II toxin-antitoxin system Phd/YefM family antitoxin [Allocoprobacillus halotolerans]|uniref:Antitoxin n=1 Tax=Allocoprobacillus halotolerans TaxID=2944914 RepID=A0ABY5I2E1_9FIRM|nr:type II toxin-antitoxin system Phd/YefM family antitoxin [Allocoprobacillus halotolerans]UTY39537.1 type II toxin-antitoxin system Phd/YefM family antitoxin [Allocoprobacillus halotolerans]